ncbi:MAG: response regulator [Gammaproteobacteria bacterium]|uniref:response regulator n=1 Tax=Rhodoferax sp. TaxID=50421 RepID=UPI00179802CF|nr:response regulator [Rhodoferax sp.]MBU3898252.1 response regulator [Gammaproteobacteria bacterium]MBA3059049.1 response regulator [Rhodoferax sp.]MBU3997002.1 response regulator [Gammaproteobacteria bacterium]MBU4081437.1 response regulator [Gammaproteobacteria bacterium]MBU4114216.1 response regulator [Gammaproteobacteria bacterium]
MSIFDRFWGSSKKPEPALTPVVAAPATERRNRKRKNANRGANALIIDDSATVVAALRRMLRSAGYATREAADAESGLALITQDPPDLVFLDIVLPGMNGFGALRVIRKTPSTQHIPVIMISGNEHATEQFYANRIGADDFLKKPFSRFELFAHIESLLDDSRMPRRKADMAGAKRPASVAAAVDVVADAVRDTVPAALTVLTPLGPQALAPAAAERWSALDARKALTAMGLQYFNPAHFFAAIRRDDQLAVALFLSSAAVPLNTPFEGETALDVAQKTGIPHLINLLQRHASLPQPNFSPKP